MEPFRQRTDNAISCFYSGELLEAAQAAWEFIEGVIEKYDLCNKYGYHTETRAISLANVNINDTTNGHFSDNEIIQVLDLWDEVVAFSYISRNSMNCAEVIMVDLLESKTTEE